MSKRDGKKSSGGSSSNGFKALGLCDPVYQGIVRMGFRMPTPVQRKALPVILTGVDTVVMARTGSGKTCAFLIPLLEKLLSTPKGLHGSHVRGLILSPTRELSMQTFRVFTKMASDMDVRAVGIHGGEGMEKQFDLLSSKPDVIIATPGRLSHHLSEIPDFKLGGCMMCILDEADRLIEMGFAMQLRQIARTLPESCSKVMLSATMPKMLVEFTKSGFAADPSVVRLDNEATVSDDLRISFITCRSADKDAALLQILRHIEEDREAHSESRTGLSIVFAATRHHVEYIHTLLSASGIASTMVYGSLDHEARKSNLSSFRSGKTPVLCVTDVAARGIDLPFLDHAVHYHFPPAPKLFVHRSGRVARAGRVGYCWGLVEPEEMPYMIDLHLFLGRRPTSSVTKVEEESGKTIIKELSYTLEEMTPDMVHYGTIPESILNAEVENVQRIMSSELRGSAQAETLRALTKVCRNGMKQYRRTRTEASRSGVRRAKEILEGKRLDTGQRVGGGAIPPHPLLKAEESRLISLASSGKAGIATAENLKKREDFLVAMSNFRPKETVFEAFATGGGKDVGVSSHVDKGRTTSTKKHDTSAGLVAMKNMRRQMRIVRENRSSLVVAGSQAAQDEGEGVEEREDEVDRAGPQPEKLEESSIALPDYLKQDTVISHSKRRLTKAERRRMKKNPSLSIAKPEPSSSDRGKKIARGADFRDPTYFMENDFSSNPEEAHRSRTIEAAMQPSASSASRGTVGTALRIEEAMLDIVGDENEDLVRKQRMLRWDKSKRKYVQTTIGEELSGDSKSKKVRLESGQLMKNDKAKLGELYEKWQKKTNRSIGRSGVFDDDDGGGEVMVKSYEKKGKNSGKGKVRKTDELKSSSAIKKERERKANLKMKNMKKDDRRSLERKQKGSKQGGGQRMKSHR